MSSEDSVLENLISLCCDLLFLFFEFTFRLVSDFS